mgnify:CR=1 FL=1
MTRSDLGWGLGALVGLLMAVVLAPVWVPCAMVETWNRRCAR